MLNTKMHKYSYTAVYSTEQINYKSIQMFQAPSLETMGWNVSGFGRRIETYNYDKIDNQYSALPKLHKTQVSQNTK